MNRRMGFFVDQNIHVPHHLREFYVCRALKEHGWDVTWFLPKDGSGEDVLPLDWPVDRYAKLDVKGHKVLFPIYFATLLRAKGIRLLWISGWAIRDPDELGWFTRILRAFGIRLIYDTVDPVDLFAVAHGATAEEAAVTRQLMAGVYERCELIFTVTPELAELISCPDEHRGSVVTFRWGTDGSVFSRDRAKPTFRDRLGLSENVFLVGWLGSMNPFKGIEEVLIPVAERAAKELEDIHFVIAGYGILEDRLKDWANADPSLPVTLLGRIPYDQAPDFTLSLDAYLIPTNPESEFAQAICPVKAFDALALGVDTLITRTAATEFLEERSPVMHLIEFDREQFYRKLRMLWERKPGDASHRVDDSHGEPVTHQNESGFAASVIEQRFSGA